MDRYAFSQRSWAAVAVRVVQLYALSLSLPFENRNRGNIDYEEDWHSHKFRRILGLRHNDRSRFGRIRLWTRIGDIYCYAMDESLSYTYVSNWWPHFTQNDSANGGLRKPHFSQTMIFLLTLSILGASVIARAMIASNPASDSPHTFPSTCMVTVDGLVIMTIDD
jgi:hypothetical protein